FVQTQTAAAEYVSKLRDALRKPEPLAGHALVEPVISAAIAYWRQAGAELDVLLQQRIEHLYQRMAINLGSAALVWLAALCFTLVIARQITRPIRELATVAERVRYGRDYDLRARGRAGGEIGSLIAGFNAMLDRLQHEAMREQERVAEDRATEAQRQLIGAIPAVISVTSEADGRILYTNTDSWPPFWLSICANSDPKDVLGML